MPGTLVPGLSTTTSDTYRTRRGPLVTRIYSAPVNYRDAQGSWHAIDNTLVSVSGGFANAANSFALHVPGSLSAPVSISDAGRSLSFSLEGAQGTGRTSGDTASYPGALPSADVAYRALGDGVQESVTLRDSSAPSSLRFDLAGSAGLDARQLADGTVQLIDSGGTPRFWIPPSVAFRPGAQPGSAQRVPTTLTRSASGWVLSLDTGVAWLRSLLASGPVVVDPTVTVSASTSCSMDEAFPSWNACSRADIWEGYNSPDNLHALLQFSLSSIPADSTILNAQLGLYINSKDNSNTKAVGVYRISRSWTTGVTWSKYDDTNSWTTAGGDYSTGSDAVVNPSIGGSTGWVYWYPTQMVQEWVDGPNAPSSQPGYSNYGLIIRDQTEHVTTNEIDFASASASSNKPYLQVAYEPRGIGDQSQFTILSQDLTDGMTMGVNVGSGNLMVQSADLRISGTAGFDFTSTRTWNNLNTEQQDYYRWSDSNDDPLHIWSDGSVSWGSPAGQYYPFIKQGSNFITPPGLKAIMCTSASASPCPSDSSGATYWLYFENDGSRIEFSSSGQITALKDRFGNTISYTYNPSTGLYSKITDSQGRAINYTWTSDENISQISDASGSRSTSYGYTIDPVTGKDDLTSYTDANGNTTSFSYSSYNLSSITDPNGNVTNFTYDSSGRITKIVRTTNSGHTTGPTWTFTYYAVGSAPAGCPSTDKASVVTDPDGNDGASGHTTTYCANVDDQVDTVIDANGNSTSATFDSMANTTSVTVPGSSGPAGVNSLVFDSSGQNLLCGISGTSSRQTSCPSGGLSSGFGSAETFGDTTFPFLPTTLTDPQQNAINECYYGGSVTCTGASGFSGPNGALKEQTDGLSAQNTQSFAYNSNGTISSYMDALGNTTTYGYDSNGNLTSMTPPSGSGLGQETITVDADSRPRTITQCLSSGCATSETDTITYDNMDRVTQELYTGPGSTITISYTYDKDGNLTKTVDPTGTTTDTYDALSRLTNESLPGSVSNAYAYDDSSNMTSFTDGGGTTTYSYNGLNQLASMYEPTGNCGGTPSLCTTFAYNPAGQLTTITYPSGVTVNYTLDASTGRVTAVTSKNSGGTTLLGDTYSYSNGGNDTSLIQSTAFSAPGSSTSNSTTYTYDALDRLLKAVTTGTNPSYYQYDLDGAGNRTDQLVNTTGSTSTGATTTDYTFNAGDQLLCRQTVTGSCTGSNTTELSGYSYDQAGNQTAITGYGDPLTTSFSYNNANQVSSLTPPGGSALSVSYLGTGQGKLVGLGSGTTLQNSDLGVTKQTDSTGTSYYARTPDGLLIDERTPSGNYNPLYDSQGDVIGLTDSSGNLARSFRYGPYGEDAQSSGSSSVPAPFLFQGGYHTPGGNTGNGNVSNNLYHFGQRYYDPMTGRWTQPDPLSQIYDPLQADAYAFAGDDPINLTDLSGELFTIKFSIFGVKIRYHIGVGEGDAIVSVSSTIQVGRTKMWTALGIHEPGPHPYPHIQYDFKMTYPDRKPAKGTIRIPLPEVW